MCFFERAQALSRRLEEARRFFQLVLPRLAVYLSDAIVGLATILAGFALYLIVAVPLQVHFLHSKLSRLENQLTSMGRDLDQTTQLLTQLTQRFETKQGVEEGAFVAKPPLAPLSSKGNPAAQV